MHKRVIVVGSLCVSVKSHLTSGASVHPENTVTYSAGNGGQNNCGVFSETTPLQRSSTVPLKACVWSAIFCGKRAHERAIARAFSRVRAHVAPRVLHFSALIITCFPVHCCVHFWVVINENLICIYIHVLGNATRMCRLDLTWNPPNVTNCQSRVFVDIMERVSCVSCALVYLDKWHKSCYVSLDWFHKVCIMTVTNLLKINRQTLP